MDIVIASVIGVIVGVVVTALIMRVHFCGNLRVDHSIPEDAPLVFLELTKSVDMLVRQKFIVLKIRVEDFISHK